MADISPFDWQPLDLPPRVLAGLREKSVLCLGLIKFDRQWGPRAWIADVRPTSKASELLKDPTRRSEIYEGLAYTSIEFQGIGDERIVVARHERKETMPSGLHIYTDLLLFSVDETQLSEDEGESLYGILTLAKVVMDRSEGQVEKIPETLFSALIPLSTTIKDVIEGFSVIRAPKLDLQDLGLLALLFVDLRQKKVMRRFWPDLIEHQDSSEMELFLFRMVTRQPEPPWSFASLSQSKLPWGFHTATEFNGVHLTTLYSKSFGMALAALTKSALSPNVLSWFNLLLSLLEDLGLDHDGDIFKELFVYLMASQHSEPESSKERHILEMILRSKSLIPLFQREQVRSELVKFPPHLFLQKFPSLDTLINELGTDSIYTLAQKINAPLSDTIAMIRFLQSRDLIRLQRVGT